MEKFTYKYKLLEKLADKYSSKLDDKYLSLKKAILELIDNSDKFEKDSDIEVYIDKLIENKENLIGLTDDADIYNFYLKYIGQIDELCNDTNFFEITPIEMNIISLYDYIIEGTKYSVEEILKILKKEIFK